MPNWCDNSTIITGSPEEISTFLNDFGNKTGNYQFKNIVPLPRVHDDDDLNDYYAPVKAWGTKWDLILDKDYWQMGMINDDEICLNYLTAWSPPEEFWVAVSQKYPGLKIDLKYVEQGVGFYGNLIVHNGETLVDISEDFRNIDYWIEDTEEFWEALFNEPRNYGKLIQNELNSAPLVIRIIVDLDSIDNQINSFKNGTIIAKTSVTPQQVLDFMKNGILEKKLWESANDVIRTTLIELAVKEMTNEQN